MHLTRSAYARYRRCTAGAVTRAAERGDVVFTVDDKVDVEATNERWPLREEPDMEGIDTGDMTFDEAQRRERAAKAQLAELELDQQKGLLIEAAAAHRIWWGVLRSLRNRVQQVATTAAPECIGRDVVTVEAIIRRHIDAALAEVSEDDPPEVTR